MADGEKAAYFQNNDELANHGVLILHFIGRRTYSLGASISGVILLNQA